MNNVVACSDRHEDSTSRALGAMCICISNSPTISPACRGGRESLGSYEVIGCEGSYIPLIQVFRPVLIRPTVKFPSTSGEAGFQIFADNLGPNDVPIALGFQYALPTLKFYLPACNRS